MLFGKNFHEVFLREFNCVLHVHFRRAFQMVAFAADLCANHEPGGGVNKLFDTNFPARRIV
jgi:hypothetical protein